ncbi:hypothetical protein ABK040_012610 [Willaertia magna]
MSELNNNVYSFQFDSETATYQSKHHIANNYNNNNAVNHNIIFTKHNLLNNKKEITFENLENIKTILYNNTDTIIYVTTNGKSFTINRQDGINKNVLNICENKSLQNLKDNNEIFIYGCDVNFGKIKLVTNCGILIGDKFIKLPELEIGDKFKKLISSGRHAFVFLLTEMGKVYIYGENIDGALGISNSNNKNLQNLKNEFILHPDLINFKIEDLHCGYLFTVFRCENGNCYGSGYNCYINIGVSGGRTMTIKEFTLIKELEGKVKQHVCGSFHSLYLTYENEVYACG